MGTESEMAEDKTIIELAPILRLPPVDTEQIHPHALDRYLEFLQEVYKEVPTLYLLNDADLEVFLSDEDRAKFKASVDEIKGWLQKCNKDNDEATLMVYAYHTPFSSMTTVTTLLEEVYKRKLLKERRLKALEAIHPPFDDAEKYLSEKESQRFRQSLLGAADAYLDGGKGCILNDWRFDRRAGDYVGLTGIMKKQKEKEARYKQAEVEHTQFKKEINNTVEKFKLDLAKEKKPKFAYPPALAKYEPHEWAELELPTKGQVKQWAEPYVWKKVPQTLKPFVSWEPNWEVQTLPYAKYELLGVACLTWCFKVLFLVEAHLRLMEKSFVKEFHGYEYQMRSESEELGYFYLGKVEWDDQEAFTTPIALLSMLAEGKLEDEGIEVMAHDGSSISFWVSGYDEGFTKIAQGFRQFIIDTAKNKTVAQGLLAAGVIDNLLAQLVEEKVKLPLPQLTSAGAGAGESTIDNSGVLGALESLGFKAVESKKAIEATHLTPGMSLEERVQAVLKNIGA